MTKKVITHAAGESRAQNAVASEAPKKPTRASGPEAGHHWRGGGVEPGTAAHESAEDAARRAEGNASVTAGVAAGAEGHGGATAVAAGGSAVGAVETKEARADEAENEEEKRQAAAEEHAAGTVKHAPHGNL